MLKVNVIGNGIVGLCSAHSLLMRGFGVRLFGRDDPEDAASWGCAGHIATEQCDPLASWAMVRQMPMRLAALGGPVSLPIGQIGHWLPFSLRLIGAAGGHRFAAGRQALSALLRDAMASWADRLCTVSAPALLLQRGHLVCWGDGAAAMRGMAAWRDRCPPYVSLASPEARDFPMLDRLGIAHANAIRFNGTGQISDLAALRARLIDSLRAGGAEFIEQPLMPDQLRAFATETTLVAAGWRSARLLAGLGLDIPLTSERGYHVEIGADESVPDTVPIALESRSMIMTRFRDRLRFASFVEFGDGDSAPDRRKWLWLERQMRGLGFDASRANRWHGSRPTLPDYLPAIGQVAGRENIYYAFGHQHLGLTLGSITGDLMGAMIAGDALPISLAPYSLERFSGAGGSGRRERA